MSSKYDVQYYNNYQFHIFSSTAHFDLSCPLQGAGPDEREAENRLRVKFPRGRVCSQGKPQVCRVDSTIRLVRTRSSNWRSFHLFVTKRSDKGETSFSTHWAGDWARSCQQVMMVRLLALATMKQLAKSPLAN